MKKFTKKKTVLNKITMRKAKEGSGVSVVSVMCVISALSMMISTLISCLAYFGAINGEYPQFDINTYKDGRLDPTYLNIVWQWRDSLFPAQIALDFFMASVSAFFFLFGFCFCQLFIYQNIKIKRHLFL